MHENVSKNIAFLPFQKITKGHSNVNYALLKSYKL